MLRRSFSKLLGAAYGEWNHWVGGEDGLFFSPDSWSHKRVPVNGDSFYIDKGCLEMPGGLHFKTIVVNGRCTLTNEPDAPVGSIDIMIVTDKARKAGITIGTQGRTL